MSRLALCLLLLLAVAPARAADSIFADPKVDPKTAPEAYLQAKGLLKAGANYVLQVDANLPALLRDVRAAKVKSDAATAKRADLERQIERATDAYIAAQREVAAVSEQMSRVKKGDARGYNELVGDARAADVRRLEAGRVIDAKQKELARVTEGQHDYVGLAVALAEQMQAAAKQYAALAADAGVATALAAINARGGAKVALGPSGQFTAELAAALQARDVVAARAIRLTFEGGTPHALVTLNGKTSILMTVDSGASLVTVTADVAKDMGLRPDPGVAPLTLVVADGKRVEARQATIATVRVGPYTVSDVKCAIMPASVKGSNLLGGTFLRNFTVRLDIAARELHMTPVGPQVVVSAAPAGVTTATRPSPTPSGAAGTTSKPTTTSPVGTWIKVDTGVPINVHADGSVTIPSVKNPEFRQGRWKAADDGKGIVISFERGDTCRLRPDDKGLLVGKLSPGGSVWVLRPEAADPLAPTTPPDAPADRAKPAFSPVGTWTKVSTGTRFTFAPDGTVAVAVAGAADDTPAGGTWVLGEGESVVATFPKSTVRLKPNESGHLVGRGSDGKTWALRRE